jgi:hypothetical protein
MKLYLVLFNDGKGIAPYLWDVLTVKDEKPDMLHLYSGQAIDLLLDKDVQPLCKLQNGQTVYTVVVKTLPRNMVAFDITKHVKLLTSDAFFALKVFTLKCKFSAIATMAMEKHGSEQQKNWYKVIGFMEPIFNGGWM